MAGKEITNPHWGCGSNEERSPFHTGKATCAGDVTARRVSYGFGTAWKCAKHWAEYIED